MAGVFDTPHSFNHSGLLYSYYGNDGKFRLWDTSTGILKQEYTKNLHLSTPCTCLAWIQISKKGEARKRKLKSSPQTVRDSLDVIALGTSNGGIILYCVATNSVQSQLEGHNAKVNYVAASTDNILFSCSDDSYLIEWDLLQHKIKSKWKSGGEKISCLLALSNGKNLLSASSTIKLWDVEKKQVLKLFKGHGTAVNSLLEVPDRDGYFISAAKGDRVINAWSLKSKEESEPLASFLLQDGASSVNLTNSEDGVTNLCAVTDSGVLHVFKHKLNGNTLKPLKPLTNITIASGGSASKHNSQQIPVQSVLPLANGSILIAYGNSALLSFETLPLDNQQENTVLIRESKRKLTADEFNSKTKVPITDNEMVEYQTTSTAPPKRSRHKTLDVPLEQRLENLALAKPQAGETYKKDSMAQLLLQGLQSRDKVILQQVLFTPDPSVITTTVQQLPVQSLVPLIKELTNLLQGKTLTSRYAMKWLTSILKTHSGILLANPDIGSLLEPVTTLIDARLTLLPQLLRLRGRLTFVAEQLVRNAEEDEEENEIVAPIISYQDQDSSEEGEMEATSEGNDSDDNWDEFSDMEDNDQEDEEMEEK